MSADVCSGPFFQGTLDGHVERVPEDDREAFIRQVFGLPRRAPLPPVSRQTLRRYYQFLKSRFSFPFAARYFDETSPLDGQERVVQVQGLLDPDVHPGDEWTGLLCTVRAGDDEFDVPLAEIEAIEDQKAHGMVEDYWYWFYNWRPWA